jgi:hypothetical protein
MPPSVLRCNVRQHGSEKLGAYHGTVCSSLSSSQASLATMGVAPIRAQCWITHKTGLQSQQHQPRTLPLHGYHHTYDRASTPATSSIPIAPVGGPETFCSQTDKHGQAPCMDASDNLVSRERGGGGADKHRAWTPRSHAGKRERNPSCDCSNNSSTATVAPTCSIPPPPMSGHRLGCMVAASASSYRSSNAVACPSALPLVMRVADGQAKPIALEVAVRYGSLATELMVSAG